MLVILFLVAVLANVVLVVSTYRQLISLKEETHVAWSRIDTLLKRRHQIIPNLLKEITGAVDVDQEILETVAAARDSAVRAALSATPEHGASAVDAEKRLTVAVTRLLAELEARRDRSTPPAVCMLQHELSVTNSEVAAAWQAYDRMAMEYNVVQQQFPTVILTGLAEAAPVELWQVNQKNSGRQDQCSSQRECSR